MAADLIQRTEDRRQRTEVLSRHRRAFSIRAAKRHTNICLRSSVFCLLMSVLCPLAAESLPDPTRPPAEISAPAAGGQTAISVNNGLQSIIISPSRRAAIINGQTVELGAKYGNARLVEVSERGVVLEGKQGKQTLALFPGVQLKLKGAAAPTQNAIVKPARQKITKDKSANKAVKPATPEEEK